MEMSRLRPVFENGQMVRKEDGKPKMTWETVQDTTATWKGKPLYDQTLAKIAKVIEDSGLIKPVEYEQSNSKLFEVSKNINAFLKENAAPIVIKGEAKLDWYASYKPANDEKGYSEKVVVSNIHKDEQEQLIGSQTQFELFVNKDDGISVKAIDFSRNEEGNDRADGERPYTAYLDKAEDFLVLADALGSPELGEALAVARGIDAQEYHSAEVKMNNEVDLSGMDLSDFEQVGPDLD